MPDQVKKKKRRRLNEDEVERILHLVYNEDMPTPDVATQFNLAYHTVRHIVTGRSWKAVHKRIVGDREPPSHPRVPRGEQHKKAKLTQEQVDEIRHRVAAGEHKRNLGWEFGVSQRTIHRIAIGESWTFRS